MWHVGTCRYGWGQGVREQGWEKAGRDESYPSRGQSLAVRVWAHGQGTVEPHTSICSTVSALEEEREREILSVFYSLPFTENSGWNWAWMKHFKHSDKITIKRPRFELNIFQTNLVSKLLKFYLLIQISVIIHTVVLLMVLTLWVFHTFPPSRRACTLAAMLNHITSWWCTTHNNWIRLAQ